MFKTIKEKISAFINLLKTNAEKDVKEAEEAVIKDMEKILHGMVDGWEGAIKDVEALSARLAAAEAKLEVIAAAPAIASDIPAAPAAPESPAAPLPEGPASQSDPLPQTK